MSKDAHQYVEILIVQLKSSKLKAVRLQTATWRKSDNGFGDESYGYPLDKGAKDRIYSVCDDGVRYSEHICS